MDVRTLISDEDKRVQFFVVAPANKYMNVPNDKISLIAVVVNEKWWKGHGDISNTHWRFFRYGTECDWDDLSDEQRLEVRTRTAWDGQVRDYWTGLEYEDERYYIWEALS